MAKLNLEAQNPLILRCNRLMEAFAKSDDERDFYLDRLEGFIIYIDLDKSEEELVVLESELLTNQERYCMIPKLTFYEMKKIMEGFINEKVYDIDTKEKLIDIIQSKEARENFLEFIYDHLGELEKWQIFYQERSRIRIIEWLRANHFHFVFEEDLDFPKNLLEKVKKELFQTKVGKDILNARKIMSAKSKTYYSNEALNPRPKRGRPPKQALKAEIEPQITIDIYTTVPNGLRGFLFTPDLSNPASSSFSSKFSSDENPFVNKRSSSATDEDLNLESLNLKLAALRHLSTKWVDSDSDEPVTKSAKATKKSVKDEDEDFDDEDDFDDEGDDDDFEESFEKTAKKLKKEPASASKSKTTAAATKSKPAPKTKAAKPTKAAAVKPAKLRPAKPIKVAKTAKPAKEAAAPAKKTAAKAPPATKTKALRPLMKLKKKK